MQRYDLVYTDNKMSEAKRALILACLNLRHGKRRLQKGRSVAGIAALYDALLFGMHYFVAKAERDNTLHTSHDELWDHANLYQRLVKAGIFDDPYAFNRLSLVVERALWQGSLSLDADIILKEIEEMLTQLGVFNKIPREFMPLAKQKSMERR